MTNQTKRAIARDVDKLDSLSDFHRQNHTDFLAWVSRMAKRDILTIAR